MREPEVWDKDSGESFEAWYGRWKTWNRERKRTEMFEDIMRTFLFLSVFTIIIVFTAMLIKNW